MTNLANALQERFNRVLFKRAAMGIRMVGPARFRESKLTVLSMVNHRDVDAYLVALKSFCHNVSVGRAVLIADPTLTEEDKAVLREHAPGLEMRDARQYHDGLMPKGGTWERLAAISDEVANGYVTQLDADTVSLAPLEEVGAAMAANRAFLLASTGSADIAPCTEMARRAKARVPGDTHIQTWAEASLDVLPATYMYARACSGFAGFPRGSFDRKELVDISRRMQHVLGERWNTWGTEQVTSNVVCASQPGAQLMPHPRYCNANYEQLGATVFLHFIGYARYRDARYREVTKEVIRALQ